MIEKNKRIQLAKEIHQNAVAKGFWKTNSNMDEKYMLIISELSEAIEAHRECRWANKKAFRDSSDENNYKMVFEAYMKDRVEDELADAYIRCMDSLYKSSREYFVIHPVNIQWSDNFGENLLKITKEVCERQINYAVSYIEGLCKHMDIDLEWFVESKMEYNNSRERLHGKEY